MNNALISVIVPCFNHGYFLDDTLNSVYQQTYLNWECIIVDDGSIDNTKEIALNWIKKDQRFKYFYKNNEGRSVARNFGVEKSTGDWIQFLDSDDLLHSEKLSYSSQYFRNSDLVLTEFDFLTINKERKLENNFKKYELNYESILLNWEVNFVFPPHIAILKKSIFRPFKIGIHAKEDWLFWLDIFNQKISYKIIEEPLAIYNIHDQNTTANLKEMITHNKLVSEMIYAELDNIYKKPFLEKRIHILEYYLTYLLERNEKLQSNVEELKNSKYMKFRRFIFNLIGRESEI
jgi:glycosyltransferase involved in cell wall biosynthesis